MSVSDPNPVHLNFGFGPLCHAIAGALLAVIIMAQSEVLKTHWALCHKHSLYWTTKHN